jgi:cell division protein FtsW
MATCITLIPKIGFLVHGSRRWISCYGINIQPSEFLKLFLFLYLGFFLEKKQYYIKSFLRTYVPFLSVLLLCFVILLRQPDFGSVITIFCTSFLLFFIAEFRMIYLVATGLCAFPVIVYLILFKTYRLNRILVFLNPWVDPHGKGFQIIQSLIAISSGHILGAGVSNSRQKFFYLPMQHTDFIFSIIAEEMGLIGTLFIVMLYTFFCFFGFKLALQFRSPFTFFSSIGFIIVITLQALINIMVTTALLPTKGLGLPFISYGGSALVSCWCMIGFIVNATRLEVKNA